MQGEAFLDPANNRLIWGAYLYLLSYLYCYSLNHHQTKSSNGDCRSPHRQSNPKPGYQVQALCLAGSQVQGLALVRLGSHTRWNRHRHHRRRG